MRGALPLLNQFSDAAGNPTVDGIFCCNESSAAGMLDSLASIGLERQVKLIGFDCGACLGLERRRNVVGFDSGEPLIQALGDGTIDALILQDPYRMGYLGTW